MIVRKSPFIVRVNYLKTFVSSLTAEFPIFRSIPAFEVEIPVVLAIRCFIFVIPNARFHEKLRPGIGVDFLLIEKQCITFLYSKRIYPKNACVHSTSSWPCCTRTCLSFRTYIIIHSWPHKQMLNI